MNRIQEGKGMSGRYVVVERTTGHVLSSPSDVHDPGTGRIALSLWGWVPDPDGRKGHHFASRGDAKGILRSLGRPLSEVSFRKAA